jgi:hypothetical protein
MENSRFMTEGRSFIKLWQRDGPVVVAKGRASGRAQVPQSPSMLPETDFVIQDACQP